MDCSGAVTFILKQGGITPPRTAAAQHEWLKKLLHLS
jgi:cell wall-associated NlpC family hydrolase